MPTDKDYDDAKGLLTLIYAGVALNNPNMLSRGDVDRTPDQAAHQFMACGEAMANAAEKRGLLDIFIDAVHS